MIDAHSRLLKGSGGQNNHNPSSDAAPTNERRDGLGSA